MPAVLGRGMRDRCPQSHDAVLRGRDFHRRRGRLTVFRSLDSWMNSLRMEPPAIPVVASRVVLMIAFVMVGGPAILSELDEKGDE